MDLGDNHRLVIGQALVGRVIYHMSSSPFPASIELSEEVVGIGKDFEKIVNAYVEHVIQVKNHLLICLGFWVEEIILNVRASSHV